MFILIEERNVTIEELAEDSPTLTTADIDGCTSSSSLAGSSHNTSNNENISSVSEPRKKKKKEMTAYEEALLQLQKEKHKMTIEFMRFEHEAKVEAIATENTHRKQLHDLQMKELLLKMKRYQNDDA